VGAYCKREALRENRLRAGIAQQEVQGRQTRTGIKKEGEWAGGWTVLWAGEVRGGAGGVMDGGGGGFRWVALVSVI